MDNPWIWVLVALVAGAAAAIYYVLKPKEKQTPRQKTQQKRDDVSAEVDRLLKGREIPGNDFVVGHRSATDASSEGDISVTAEAVTKKIEGNHHP